MCVFDPWHYQAIRKIVRFEAPYHLLEGDRKIPDEVTVFVTLEEWGEHSGISCVHRRHL